MLLAGPLRCTPKLACSSRMLNYKVVSEAPALAPFLVALAHRHCVHIPADSVSLAAILVSLALALERLVARQGPPLRRSLVLFGRATTDHRQLGGLGSQRPWQHSSARHIFERSRRAVVFQRVVRLPRRKVCPRTGSDLAIL